MCICVQVHLLVSVCTSLEAWRLISCPQPLVVPGQVTMVWNATDRAGNVAEAVYRVAVLPAAGTCSVTGTVVQTSYNMVGSTCGAVQLSLNWTSSTQSLTAVEVTWDTGVTRSVTPAPGARSLQLNNTYSSAGRRMVGIKIMNGCTSSVLQHPILIRPPTGERCQPWLADPDLLCKDGSWPMMHGCCTPLHGGRALGDTW